MEPFYSELGLRIQGYRKRAGLTQAELGGRLTPPLTRASVANIESAKQRLLAHTLVEVAQVLGVDLSELVPSKKAQRQSNRGLENELAQKLNLGKGKAKELAALVSKGARS